MTGVEHAARPTTIRREPANPAPRPLRWSTRCMASVRGDSGVDAHSSLRPEDVARSEVFFNSTCCWV